MKKLILVLFFLVTWTVERTNSGLDFYAYEENPYGLRFSKKSADYAGALAFERQNGFPTLEAARKFIREAPKGRSEYGDRAFDFKIQAVRDVK